MNTELDYVLQKFSQTPGRTEILYEMANELIIPKLIHLTSTENYIIYLTIISFPNRSIKHGEIILKSMLNIGLLNEEYLNKEKKNLDILPNWVQTILKQY